MKKIIYTIVTVIVIIGGLSLLNRNKSAEAPVNSASNAEQMNASSTYSSAQYSSTTMATSTISTSTLSTYTMTDVAKHNKADDCWFVIDGNVLDVTEFIASGKHNDKIINGCGIDATKLFKSQPKHAGPVPQSLYPQFIIGKLAE